MNRYSPQVQTFTWGSISRVNMHFCLIWAWKTCTGSNRVSEETISISSNDPAPADLPVLRWKDRSIMRHRKDVAVQKIDPVWQFREQDPLCVTETIKMISTISISKLKTIEEKLVVFKIVIEVLQWAMQRARHWGYYVTWDCPASAFTELII